MARRGKNSDGSIQKKRQHIEKMKKEFCAKKYRAREEEIRDGR